MSRLANFYLVEKLTNLRKEEIDTQDSCNRLSFVVDRITRRDRYNFRLIFPLVNLTPQGFTSFHGIYIPSFFPRLPVFEFLHLGAIPLVICSPDKKFTRVGLGHFID